MALAVATVATSAATSAAHAVPGAATEQRSTFMVVLQDDQPSPGTVGEEMARRHGGSLGYVYEHALRGFTITLPDEAARAVARDRRVTLVERDQVARTATQTIPTGVARTYADQNSKLSINGVDDARVDVDLAIIDTGVDAAHPDLRVVAQTDCTVGTPFRGSCRNGTAPDVDGHGTHVAGSAAALDNGVGVVGVAPGARLHAVKVLGNDGAGYISWIVAGVDYVTKRADTIEVANMSLGCECPSGTLDRAIANSVAKGVTYVVAAGNSRKDASTFNPASHPDVITVSALADFDGRPGGLVGQTTSATHCRADQDDTDADFSNFGKLVELAAPGVCITSTFPGGGYATYSGTSMASPHVAGAAALLASRRTTATRADTVAIRDTLVATGSMDWTDASGDGQREPLLDVRNTTEFAPQLQ